jgi:hypothetical protein
MNGQLIPRKLQITSELLTIRELLGSVKTSAFMGTNPENGAQAQLNECIGLKSSVENTCDNALRFSANCSELCPQNKSSQWAIRRPIHRIGA